ncbi:MAG TPA: hypothetical protein VLV32_00110 [Burkholderiales bacterium]|nr:hypothetical protein [Burkholderiales bacterium]
MESFTVIALQKNILRKEFAPGIQYPRVPGNEVAGVIDAVGQSIEWWQPSQRVGVGWNGGYTEYVIAPASAVALVPAELPATEAAPLMCAGITTFNAPRNSGAPLGDVVAVLGLRGLGHFGIKYAAKMSFHTVGIARGKD